MDRRGIDHHIMDGRITVNQTDKNSCLKLLQHFFHLILFSICVLACLTYQMKEILYYSLYAVYYSLYAYKKYTLLFLFSPPSLPL